MKKFLYKTIAFLSPAILLGVLVFAYYFYQKTKVDSELERISSYECILLGDSQIQRINPKYFSQKTYNLASSGEHYYFTYQKLNTLISFNNHQINTVILGVSIHNFAPIYNRLFDLKHSEGQSSLREYLYFIRPGDFSFLGKKELTIKSLVKGLLLKPNWGGLKESTNINPDSSIIKETIKMHYSISDKEDKFSFNQLKYLHLIDSLCQAHHIDLYLVSTPYHPYYQASIPSGYSEHFEELIKKTKPTKYIDYRKDKEITPFMSDGNHLNTKGAALYSKKINDEIKP